MDNKLNYEKINLLDFDLLGMIKLKDIEGVEALVTPIGNGEYVSRGKLYCQQMTCAQASRFREFIKQKLSNNYGKKAFVMLDYMANFSAKVYYETIQKALKTNDFRDYYVARHCLMEDISNIVSLFDGKPIKKSVYTLPELDDMLAERVIECNNMALLYIYAKCFNVPKDYNILNAGLGGIFIGPFFKTIHGTDWTNLLKSKYVDEKPRATYDVKSNTVNFDLFKNKKVLFLDDNIGTGATAREIETEFEIKGYDVKYGAVQYNWRNFYLVGIGEKDIARFKPSDVDYLTMTNYPGHKLIDHAFKILCGRRDLQGNEPSLDNSTPAGLLYEQYKQLKSYNNPNLPDIVRLIDKGYQNCENSGIKIISNQNASNMFTHESKTLIERLNKYILKLKEQETLGSENENQSGLQ